MLIDSETLVTSSGVIRNRSTPRVGVINASSLYDDLFTDCLNNGIDLSWEYFEEEMNERIECGEISIDDAQREMEFIEFDSRQFLLGAWVKENGHYIIDKTGKNGNFALSYNTETGIVCVDWSQFTTKCCNTSPCYVMADGSGPCGDLDTPGDAVTAYTLPNEMFRNDND